MLPLNLNANETHTGILEGASTVQKHKENRIALLFCTLREQSQGLAYLVEMRWSETLGGTCQEETLT